MQISPDATAFERIFGSAAQLVSESATVAEETFALTDNIVCKLILLLLFVGYGFVLIVHGGEIASMIKLLFNKNLSMRVTDFYNRSYFAALRSCCTFGTVSIAVAIVKLLEINDISVSDTLNTSWLIPIAIAALCVVFGVGAAIAWTVGALAERNELSKALFTISSTVFSLFSVITIPLMLFSALNATLLSTIAYVALVVVAALALLLFLLKTLIFFTEQKISILFWFLYLCAVFALPVGTLATLILRAAIAQ